MHVITHSSVTHQEHRLTDYIVKETDIIEGIAAAYLQV